MSSAAQRTARCYSRTASVASGIACGGCDSTGANIGAAAGRSVIRPRLFVLTAGWTGVPGRKGADRLGAPTQRCGKCGLEDRWVGLWDCGSECVTDPRLGLGTDGVCEMPEDAEVTQLLSIKIPSTWKCQCNMDLR